MPPRTEGGLRPAAHHTIFIPLLRSQYVPVRSRIERTLRRLKEARARTTLRIGALLGDEDAKRRLELIDEFKRKTGAEYVSPLLYRRKADYLEGRLKQWENWINEANRRADTLLRAERAKIGDKTVELGEGHWRTFQILARAARDNNWAGHKVLYPEIRVAPWEIEEEKFLRYLATLHPDLHKMARQYGTQTVAEAFYLFTQPESFKVLKMKKPSTETQNAANSHAVKNILPGAQPTYIRTQEGGVSLPRSRLRERFSKWRRRIREKIFWKRPKERATSVATPPTADAYTMLEDAINVFKRNEIKQIRVGAGTYRAVIPVDDLERALEEYKRGNREALAHIVPYLESILQRADRVRWTKGEYTRAQNLYRMEQMLGGLEKADAQEYDGGVLGITLVGSILKHNLSEYHKMSGRGGLTNALKSLEYKDMAKDPEILKVLDVGNVRLQPADIARIQEALKERALAAHVRASNNIRISPEDLDEERMHRELVRTLRDIDALHKFGHYKAIKSPAVERMAKENLQDLVRAILKNPRTVALLREHAVKHLTSERDMSAKKAIQDHIEKIMKNYIAEKNLAAAADQDAIRIAAQRLTEMLTRNTELIAREKYKALVAKELAKEYAKIIQHYK